MVTDIVMTSLASALAFVVMSVVMWLALHLVGPWLDRKERRLFDALERFLKPIVDAHRRHMIVKAASVAKARMEVNRGRIHE